MLPVIEHPAALWAFLTLFDFRLYQPQLRHLLQLLDIIGNNNPGILSPSDTLGR